jgi:tripartite-type tricarboxylate transporter receptor subunit TctC
LRAAPNTINAALYDNLNFDFVRDVALIASIARTALIMLVAPSFPATTVLEFIAYAKANPGKLNMASAGNGTPPHVAGELFKMMAGIDMLHVPYRGVTPAATARVSAPRAIVTPHGAPGDKASDTSMKRGATF